MASLTTALLLTAGLGTRLRPLTLVRAKPALPVAGIPLVRRIIGWLANAGVSDVVLNLHHLPESIAAQVGDGSELGVRVRYSWEPVILGSAGGPRQALEIIGQETFLIVNGDTLTDVDLDALTSAHAASGALVTMAVVPNTRPDRYSGLRVGEEGAVLGVEPRGSATPSFHFIGVQAVRREAFVSLPQGRAANSIGGLYEALIASKPGCIRAFASNADYWDIGTVGDYWATSRAFEMRARTTPSGEPSGHEDARLVDTIVWDDVELGEGCMLRSCIVTDGVRVPPHAAYANAILMRGRDPGDVVTAPFHVEDP